MRRAFHNIAEPAGPRRLSYVEWGDRANPRVALCVHGLTRNARDFDRLGATLAESHRVICVDVAGRGESDWLADPAYYGVPTYMSDILGLLAALNIPQVDWVGTSMGGMIGMAVAASPDSGGRIAKLILNDIGPFIPKSALARIGSYVGQPWRFDDFTAAEAHIRAVHAPFGLRDDADWRYLTEISVRNDKDGKLVPIYDPAIGEGFRATEPQDMDLWPMWQDIRCPVLVLRGAESDLLTAATARQMADTGPKAMVVEFPLIGHAPALFDDDQIGAIMRWLRAEPQM